MAEEKEVQAEAPKPGTTPPAAAVPVETEVPAEPVEVELTADELAGAALETPAEPEPKPRPVKKHVPPSVRIGQLTTRAKQAEAMAAEERAKREQHERELAALRARVGQSDAAALVHYDNATTLRVEQAKQKYKAAIESGDPNLQTEAQVEVSRAVAEKTALDTWKAGQQRVRPAQPPPQAQMPQAAPAAPTPQIVNTQKWVSENGWFNPEAPEFDQEMAEEANAFATRLNRELKGRGQADVIGQDEGYFDLINAHVRTKFPEYFGEEAPVETPRRAVSTVAGVTRQASPSGQAGPSATRVVLTAEQRSMAESMMGVLKHPDGTPLSKPELHRAYAIQLLKLGRKAG